MPSRYSYFSAVSYHYKDYNPKSDEQDTLAQDFLSYEDDVYEYDPYETDPYEDVYEEEPMEEEYRITLEEKIARELMSDLQDENLSLIKTASSKPTEKEMQEEYERYCEMRRKEREEQDALRKEKEKELSDWAFSMGICANSIPGTFEERYTEMKEQKRIQLIQATDKLREERKQREEKERLERLEMMKKNIDAVAMHSRNIRKASDKKKANKCNVKGKLQGDKKGKSKRVRRAEAKKAEKERRIVQEAEKKVTGNQLIPQIDLGEEEEEDEEVYVPPVKLAPWAKVKPVRVDEVRVDEVRVDEVRVDEVKVDEVKVDEVKVDEVRVDEVRVDDHKPSSSENWTTYSKKKPVKVTYKKVHHPKNNELLHTRICNSVYEKTTCRYGDKCTFAHKISELVKKNCDYDSECKFVKKISDGVYENTGNITCKFWHPEESDTSYAIRLGIPVKEVVDPVKDHPVKDHPVKDHPVKDHPVKDHQAKVQKPSAPPPPSKIAPWAKTPVPVKTPVRVKTPVPTTPVYEEGMALILTRDELKNAVEQVISKGIKKFTIELRN